MGFIIWPDDKLPKQLVRSEEKIKELFAVKSATASSSIFPQSVASGDPQPQGITLWTRVVSPQQGLIELGFEIARDSEFNEIALRGVAQTDGSKDYTVKVHVDSPRLQPFTTYYYRFICQGTASRRGRFKTLPDPNMEVNKVRFAYVSCQDYTNGYYNSHRFLAEEDIDFVVFLGDYIYESVGDPSFQRGIRPIQLPSGQAVASSLQDYRFLYQTYKSDRDLQKLRENFAFISIWDDHEFAGDNFGTNTPEQVPFYKAKLRQWASQAWAEYTPTRITFEPDKHPLSALQIYRTFKIGNLLELIMTDQRLYRDGPPYDNLEAQQQQYLKQQRYMVADSVERKAPNRSMLGNAQRQWFCDTIINSPATWKIWGNEVMTMQLKYLSEFATKLVGESSPELFVSLDQWDGYPAERSLLFSTIKEAGVKNFVTITGDFHTFVTGYQKINFDDPEDEPIGVEFLVGSTASSNFAETHSSSPQELSHPPIEMMTQMLKDSNPHIQYFNSTAHGYNLVEVTPKALTCTLKAVSDITTSQGNLSTLKVFRVPRDRVLIEDITDA
ncbi:MAG TPA: phosphodiesterase [Cyanobacteria bacterium UBA11149]|nr:phosphodiesterase [Cyanobacteria bacterium UBA11367]HBE56225.1 phosphodiesterase [Cyanobacteria bacterium UBA11366]HBK65410.1 phosphodiesterase [Cyanobacteria bacterium UBA11166]HBR73548.1 phosphodiesterase [Cyanobacteria bacterium UBA11159]HBS71771.1 phosphodiesterase [Cyanobacteria bacterium UBA11153]HBW92222.1 phosphodiesterase [Cyanobacteria bacterium UBA11149]HCA93969.1 phosphodiesterase [Cyanobacteria bacterium UBA9226]